MGKIEAHAQADFASKSYVLVTEFLYQSPCGKHANTFKHNWPLNNVGIKSADSAWSQKSIYNF